MEIAEVGAFTLSAEIDNASSNQSGRVAIPRLWGSTTTARSAPLILIDVKDRDVIQVDETSPVSTIIVATEDYNAC